MTDQNFFGVQYDIIDEINEPAGMKMRLVENIRTKRQVIQSWGSMQGVWVTTQRYKDVQGMWNASKLIAASVLKAKEKKNA